MSYPPPAAADDRRARRLGRGDGEGDAARGRQRLGAASAARTGFRPRWEIKNMNSFTFIGRAIEAAFRQQVAAHEAGEEVVQSTYDYDPDTDRLTVHRSKEEADDYRYFPEPDLVPVEPPAELVERLRGEVPELPVARIGRLAGELGFDSAAELVATGNEWKARGARGRGCRVEGRSRDRDEPRRLPARERRARSRRSCRRTSRARRSTRRSPLRRPARSTRTTTSRAAARRRRGRARAGHRRRPRSEPGAGRDLPRRQGGRARLLRRPGDARDAGQGRPEGRQPAAAGEARKARQVADRVAERARGPRR